VYRTVCGCVEENRYSVSDGSKSLVENGDCVSLGGRWMGYRERRQCIRRFVDV
jgi:hypothetical protein